MPIYEYRCEKCTAKFDVLTSFAERDRARVCPTCESTRTRVLVSSFASLGAGEGLPQLDAARQAGGGGCCGGSCGCGSRN
jgi:putative FmdB family regulatory protein